MPYSLPKSLSRLAALVFLSAVLAGCAAQAPRTPVGVMDSPAHHFENGLNLLEQGETVRAATAFEMALSVDRHHAPSLAGKAVTLALAGDGDAALELLDEALDLAEDELDDHGPAEYVRVLGLGMWVHQGLMASGREDQGEALEAVDELFEDAQDADPGAPYPFLRRGEARLQALDFAAAEGMFRTVVELRRGYEQQADARWKLVQDALRAAPDTTAGKRIALVRSLTRADMAALLVEELDLERFYSRTRPSVDTGFVTPGQERNLIALDTAQAVTDVDAHPLAEDIRRALHSGVKGLEPYPDRTFRPDEPVTRAEAAMIFEDVVVRATGRRELATAFIGQDSRIPDLAGDHPAFNAAMVCLTRGVLDTDLRSGEFRPLDVISGIEGLLAVRRLKTELRLF